jgi:uncharacterized protein (DUF924 family)
MTAMEIDDVLSFWFGELSEGGLSSPAAAARWFKKDPAFDEEIRARFGALHARLARGGEAAPAEPRAALAYVIVLDQFSRNMYRDEPRMFASDALALSAARAIVAANQDGAFRAHERTFLYMPFMHSEALEDQNECVRLFRALADSHSGETKAAIEYNHEYAVKHRDVVQRFGRFPHRNKILGRATTNEEAKFLTEPGSSF